MTMRRRRTRTRTRTRRHNYTGGHGEHGGAKSKSKTVKAQCSPKMKNKVTGFSCYTFDDLKYLRTLWNNHHPPNSDQYISTTDPHKIHALLTKYNKPACGGAPESCWLSQPFVKESVATQIRGFAFAPLAPKEWSRNPNEWLSSTEIEDVMRQYEKAYKCFRFLGPAPIDFDAHMPGGGTVTPEIANLSIAKMQADGINKIGIIFNTDPHDKGGQHWISMFINIKRGLIYFFDSVGTKASKEIMALVSRIQQQGEHMNPPIHFKFDQNYPVEHQYGNTECGIYSLFFIVHMVEDKITSHYLKTHVLKDKYMQRFRKIYFNETL